MKKILITIFLLFIAVSLSHAQVAKGKFAIGVGGEVVLPSGDAADLADIGTGFGASARAEYGISKNLAAFAYVGYLMWPGEETTQDLGFGQTAKASWDWSAITVFGGVKYYFNKSLYAMAQLGIHSFTFDYEVSGSGAASGASGGSSSDSEFGYGVGAGYELPIGKMMLDLTAKYMLAASDFNYIGVRAGVKFPLK
jgi:hypothetical protein